MRIRKQVRRARSRWAVLVAMAVFVTACSEAPTSTAPAVNSKVGNSATNGAPKFWETNAAADWNELATSFASRRTINAARLYAYLSLAQLRAAEDADAVTPHGPVHAAIGAASAAVLVTFFPADAAEIEAALAAQESADPWPGAKHESWSLGVGLGRAAASRVLAYATGDRFGLANPGTPPIGPGYWKYNGGPLARGGFGARPFFLSAGNEFRSPPPPAFGSPTYQAALAEVRQISDTRTPEQVAIAQYWNVNQSPNSAAAMNNLAVELLRRHRRGELESARILFLMNGAAFDAAIGCFDAKFAYWYIRPPQADPLITLPIGLPPHPSYPSAHSCISGASTGVLAIAFPGERDRLSEIATVASLSRLYAGIHYRFDMEAGLALGRAVAQKAADASLGEVGVR